MKTKLVVGLTLLLMAGWLFCGCETDSANSSIQITPSSTTIRRGQSLQFTASGGYEYRWSLSRDDLGTLSTRTGPTTLYTSRVSGSGTNQTQVLTVVSTIEGQAADPTGVSTNSSVPYQSTAEAYITHI